MKGVSVVSAALTKPSLRSQNMELVSRIPVRQVGPRKKTWACLLYTGDAYAIKCVREPPVEVKSS